MCQPKGGCEDTKFFSDVYYSAEDNTEAKIPILGD